MLNAIDNQQTGDLLSVVPHIDRLWDDVFCEIFRVWADIDRPAPDRLGFIRGSHVCRLWRVIMLDLPTLWADIICTYRAASAIETFLKRARDAPLVLDFSEWSALEILGLSLPKDIWPRARVIVLLWPSTVELFMKHYKLLPTLRSLRIENSTYPGVSELNEEGHEDSFFAPSLEDMCMRKIRLTVVAPALRSLTLELIFPDELSAVLQPYTGGFTHTLPELLRTLSLYPVLDTLTLLVSGGAIDRQTNLPVLDSPVSLPHLRVLTIWGRPATVALIWKNTDTPQHAAVSCDLDWHPELDIFFESVRTLIHRPENHALFLGTETRTFARHPAHFITCFISSSPVNESELCPGSCLLKIDIQSPVWRGIVTMTVLKAVTSTSPHIESLTLHNTSIGSETQQSIHGDLALLTKIKHLRVKGDEALAQLQTLLPADVLPALKDVDIDLESNDDWRAVINLLRIRAGSLHPLDSLLLNGAIMYWDEAEKREESSLLEGLSEELHDKRKVIWKSSVDLSSLH